MADRPKVGPADPETRRKMLHEELEKPTKATGVAAKEKMPVKKKKRGMMDDVKDLLDPTKPRDRAVEGKNKTVMEAIDDGIEEGSKARME
jgi:hypothetical protein